MPGCYYSHFIVTQTKAKWLIFIFKKTPLENSPMNICMLNGLKVGFYNLIETQN